MARDRVKRLPVNGGTMTRRSRLIRFGPPMVHIPAEVVPEEPSRLQSDLSRLRRRRVRQGPEIG
jgi:hypothetical protein